MTSPTTGGSVSQRLSATLCTSCFHSLTRLPRRVCWDTGGPSMTNSKGIGISVRFSLRLLEVSVPCYPPAPMSFNPQVVCTPRAATAGAGRGTAEVDAGGGSLDREPLPTPTLRCPARADAGPACPLPMESGPVAPGVAVDAQRDRPTRRVGDHRGQRPARAPPVEATREVRRRGRICSNVTPAFRPRSANMTIFSPAGGSRNAIPTYRARGAAAR